MKELVFLKDDVPFTTSLVIAEGTDNQHESIIRLIQNNIERFGRWGQIYFSDLKSGNYLGDMRGRPTKVANLNEQQATFLITLLRNNDVVLDFKAELVDQFFKMREKIRSGFIDFHSMRQITVDNTKHLHKVIQEVVIPTARANGSTTPDKCFHSHYEKLINKTLGIPAGQRPKLSYGLQSDIARLDEVIEASIVKQAKAGATHKKIYANTKDTVKTYAEAALLGERTESLPKFTAPPKKALNSVTIQISLF